jgi:hypothetical protein
MGARAAFALYLSGTVVLTTGLQLGSPPEGRPVGALQRGLARGEIAPGVPRLDPRDPMSNAALLDLALAGVEHPGLGNGNTPCEAVPRTIAVQIGGRLSRVHFNGRAVCQLQRLKEISVAQPGFGQRGLAVLIQMTMPIIWANIGISASVWLYNFERIMLAVDDLGCRDLLA